MSRKTSLIYRAPGRKLKHFLGDGSFDLVGR